MGIFKQSNEQRRQLILNGNLTKAVIILSLPTLLFGLVQSFLPLTDSYFINKVVGPSAGGAVSYSQPIVNMMIALAQGLSVAAMAMIGQTFGKGDQKRVRYLSSQFMLFALIFGLLMIPLTMAIAIPVANSVQPEIAGNVKLYISLYAFVIPFIFGSFIFNAIKNAMGKPEDTFLRVVLLLILKLIFNYIFVREMRLGIYGSVYATIASSLLVTLWMIYDLFLKKNGERLSFKIISYDKSLYSKIFRLAFPAMLNSALLNVGFFLINTEVKKYGYVVLNGLGIAGNISSICFLLPATLGSVVTTLVSMNMGNYQVERSKTALKYSAVFSVIISIILVAIIVPLSPYLARIFTDDSFKEALQVQSIAVESLNIYIYSTFAFSLIMVIQGALVALGKTKIPLVMGILRIWFLRYLFIIFTEKYLGYLSVFYGNLFSNYVVAVLLIIVIIKVEWKTMF